MAKNVKTVYNYDFEGNEAEIVMNKEKITLDLPGNPCDIQKETAIEIARDILDYYKVGLTKQTSAIPQRDQ